MPPYPPPFSGALHPNSGLGFFILGASLHDILTRLKAEPQQFPRIDVIYDQDDPVTEPVIVSLPPNGLRLQFDGPEQRLRLIEVVDFTKNRITYQDKDIAKASTAQGSSRSPKTAGDVASGPAFKNIYHRLFGPTYAGEYVPSADDTDDAGTYVLSYPGVAFSFPLPKSAYSSDKDVVSLLSSPPSQTASSVAIFSGKSWAHAREQLWVEVLPSVKSTFPFGKSKEIVPDEISLVKIHGGGRLQLFKKWTGSSIWINLGETSPQDLVAELGAPDAIYRKNDQRMYIHKTRTSSSSRTRASGLNNNRSDDLTDTDQSSATTGSDESDDEAIEDETVGNVSGECFYNYFYMGFDILVSSPQQPSVMPPSQTSRSKDQLPGANIVTGGNLDRLVATKVVLHANVPGSYPFNRHRRSRWEISYLNTIDSDGIINSETPFDMIEERLREEWKGIYASQDDAQKRQRGMVLNRGWGDSSGSSCEFLGGWEDSSGGVTAKKLGDSEDSTTTLYGFPGLVFEVLKNGYVSAVTVY
ncbi:hypothetical protein NUW58_g5994 [Xylaria curta]|uniref:Uncharacterized protein n=1 Tax=Xylaria curta TaxID=42375 RepID=A0ACC1P0K7_9PEZI|nr:hypothetical protein NUW58_g5994 [Xylaria curta]